MSQQSNKIEKRRRRQRYLRRRKDARKAPAADRTAKAAA
jgi:hypothetical protein